MKTHLRAVVLLLVTVSTMADDITTADGTVYANVTVKRADPDALSVITSKGIVRIPFSDLGTNLQQRYHYDPTNAAAYLARKNEALKQSAVASRSALERAKQRNEAQYDEQAADIARRASETAQRAAVNKPNPPSQPSPYVANHFELTTSDGKAVDVIEVHPSRQRATQEDIFRDYYNAKKQQKVIRIGE